MLVSSQADILVCTSIYVLAALLYQRYQPGLSRFVLMIAVGYFVGWVLVYHAFTLQRVELAIER